MRARAYYNEIDPAAAQWLRNLIDAGHIARGDVDTRSIEDVTPNDLRGYTQCHFFAGIGGWSLALRLAGWPDDRRVWTGSCPCQPFSAAGRGDGFADQRHLWPAWFHLIKECRPNAVFGEQVAAAAGFGWLDLVSSDMEGPGYRVGSAVLGAHSVGAPHIRQRLWFVADADSSTCRQGSEERGGRSQGGNAEPGCGLGGDGVFGELGNSIGPRLEGLAGHGDNRDDGRSRVDQLPRQVAAALWATPTVATAGRSVEALQKEADRLHPRGQWTIGTQVVSVPGLAQVACWPTPTASLADKGVRSTEGAIREAARSHGPDLAAVTAAVPGLGPAGSSATTEKPGALAPEFVAWLMGFPPEWLDCAPETMPRKAKSK